MFNKFWSVLFLGMLLVSVNTFASSMSAQDMSVAFSSNVSVERLTDAEMSAVEGEWLFLIPVVTSALSYTASSVAAGKFAWGGLAWAAGSGLMGGGVYGSVGRALAPSIGMARLGFAGFGAGITYGLRFSNPWRR